jgi:hypothetical protein
MLQLEKQNLQQQQVYKNRKGLGLIALTPIFIKKREESTK